MYHVSKYQGFQNFMLRLCWEQNTENISENKETLNLLLNIRIILSSNKIQLLQKQQIAVLKIYVRQQNVNFNIARPLKKCWKYVLLSSQSNFSYFYVRIVSKSINFCFPRRH